MFLLVLVDYILNGSDELQLVQRLDKNAVGSAAIALGMVATSSGAMINPSYARDCPRICYPGP